MAAQYSSKHGLVARPPFELYMQFADMRNFVNVLPEEKKKDVTADFDSLKADVQGFSIGVRVNRRIPYSMIEIQDDGAPFQFTVELHFDASSSEPSKTDFYIEVSAELNMMMKMMLGGKIKEALDKIVDGLVSFS